MPGLLDGTETVGIKKEVGRSFRPPGLEHPRTDSEREGDGDAGGDGMTLEEAIKNREDCLKYLEGIGRKASPECMEAVRWSVKALKALRPVSREQVEKVWRGNWDVSYDEQNGFTYVTCSKCGDETVLNGCFVTTEGEPCGLEDFCSVCGAPMTDEAVEMVMERLEALNDGKGD